MTVVENQREETAQGKPREKIVTEDILLLQQLGRVLDSKIRRERLQEEEAVHGPEHTEEWSVRDLLIFGLLKVRGKKKGLGRLRPNRAQREYSRNCAKKNIVLKARQVGMTTYIAARYFIQTITQPGTLTVQVAHTQESAEAIFNIVHRFWENLPEGMQKGALVRSRASSRQIAFPRLDSEYRVATAADPNAGRGMTIHNLHCSEVARWPRDAEESLGSLRAAVTSEGEIVLESTPNGAGGVFYEEWQRAGEMGFRRHFFPWWYEESYRANEQSQGALSSAEYSREEQELVLRFGLDAQQIAWRRRNWSQLRSMAAQEFAEDATSCFRASGECVFELEGIERAAQLCGRPVEERENGRWRAWLPPIAGKRYIIGVDPAGGGTDGDYSCAQVVDRQTAMQCAELHGHYPPRDLAAKLGEIGRSYNDALLVVERNNHGYGVLAHLRTMGYTNLLVEGGQDGWLTSAVSRPAMIENMAAVLATAPGLFSSVRLLNECRTFVRHADGSSAAMAGAHDDCVMAMAIALAARARVAGERGRAAVAMGSFEVNRMATEWQSR